MYSYVNPEIRDMIGLPSGRAGPIAFIELVAKGLPIKVFEHVVSTAAGARPATPAFTKFGTRIVPKATMSRRVKEGHLSMREGEVVLRLANIMQFATEIWGDAETAREFLNRRNPTLEDRVPMDLLLESEIGAAIVYDLLGKLQYGSAA